MIYFWIVLAVIAGLTVAVLYAPLKISVEYRNKKLSIVFRNFLFKIVIDDRFLNKKKDKKKETENENTGIMDKIKAFKEGYHKFDGVLDEIFSLVRDKAEFPKIYLRVRYGTGDAAITGIIYGGIWSLVGNIYAFLCRFFKVKFPTVELEPVFGGKAFEIEAEGIIKTQLVHIITAVIRSVKIYSKHKKEKGAM